MKFDVGLLAERSPSPSGRRENWNLVQSSDCAGNSFRCGDVSHRRDSLAQAVPSPAFYGRLMLWNVRKVFLDCGLRWAEKVFVAEPKTVDCNFYSGSSL